MSRDGIHWVLLNASPDLGAQLRAHPPLHPRGGVRDSPIQAVVLIDSQIDHVVGLLSLREGRRLDVFCTPDVHRDLTQKLPLFTTLDSYCGVNWRAMSIDDDVTAEQDIAGLRFSFVGVAGKAPPYSDRRQSREATRNAALVIHDPHTGGRLFYAPGLARVGDAEQRWLDACDCVLVDGTFWTEDEMVSLGLGVKRAADMGHLPQCDGPEGPGMLRALEASRARRRILIHINNSNPILDERGPERDELSRRGIEVAFDGMEIDL